MTYTQEQLDKIEEMASLYMRISDMAVLLGVNNHILRLDIADASSAARDAYLRGKVNAKLLLRRQEMMLAQVGSPLALDNCHRALLDMEDDE